MSADHPADSNSRSVPWTVGLVLFLVAAYVLSIGPFFWLREHGHLVRGGTLERSLVAFYIPLEEIIRHVPPFKALMRWYIELFAPV